MSQFVFQVPDVVTPSSPPTTAGAIDHVAVALSRLLQQFKGKPLIEGLVSALVTPANAIEAALQDLLTKRQVDTAFGAQLDLIGKLVGQPRNGASDADYARFIAARIATNNSRGRVEDLITVTRLALDDSADTVLVVPLAIASVIVRVLGDVTTDAIAAIAISFLRDAVAAGVKLTLESSPDLDANTFFTAISAFTTSVLSGGNTTVPVDTTVGFPTNGTIVLDVGGVNQETVSYGNVSATAFLNCSPLAFAHANGVRVDAPTQLGRGWGDSGDAGQPTLTPYANVGTTGGRMIDARE